MIVNLNVKCKVKLNELGKVIWLSQIDSLPDDLKQDEELICRIKNQIDADGNIEMELWAIMSIFGPYINQHQSPFQTNVLNLEKSPKF